MLVLFNKNETDFTHNGLGVLDDYIISPVVTEELNGIFKLEFDYPIHAPRADGLLHERIIRCPVPDMADQLFRISERSDAIDGLYHIVAYHVFYDLAQNLIKDTNVINKNGQQAIAQILGAGQFAHPFTGLSNISAVASARLVRLNIAEVLLDGGLDNGFLARWGGEIIRDNFHISMQKVRGSNNGVCIRDKKNLTGYRSVVDFNTAVTRIMPVGFDGLLLPELYIDSPLIGNYYSPRVRALKYENVKAAVGQYADADDAVPLAQAYDMLRYLAEKDYSDNHIDLPFATYEIEFAPLERTEEYKDFAALETVSIGDTVMVVHEDNGLNITARMVGYQYDPLVKAYIAITLGNAVPQFTDVTKEIKRLNIGLQQVSDDTNFALQSANGKNMNYYGTDEPANPQIGDLWFKENGDKIEIWIYETRDGVTQWYQLAGDIVLEEMRQELERAAEEVAEAMAKAEEAAAAGEEARIAGEQAYQMGEEAKAAAEEAAQAGADALAAGQAAEAAANQAAADAANALVKANQAVADADSAITQVGTFAGVAESAWNKSVKGFAISYAVSSNGTNPPPSGWQANIPSTSDVFLWTRTVFTLQDDTAITSYSVAMYDATGSIDFDVQIITEVREQFYLSTSDAAPTGGSWGNAVPTWTSGKYYWKRIAATYDDGTVSYSSPVLDTALNQSLVTSLQANTATQELQTTVSQHATAITLAATDVAALAGRVEAAESDLTVQAGQIAAKASKTSVDEMTGRVDGAEASLTVQAGLISLKASQTSLDSLTGRVDTTEARITQNANNINLRVSKNDVVNQINVSSTGS